MSLMKSLARVAAGVMLAKGLGSIMQQHQQSSRQGSGAGSHRTGGGLLGDLINAGRTATPRSAGSSGGLGDLLGQVLGGRAGGAGTGRPYGGGAAGAGAAGGLGAILDNLTRGTGTGAGTGGRMAGGLAGGAAAGGLGGLLGGLLNGPAQRGAQPSNDATFGEVFNDAVARQDEPDIAPTPEQNAIAGLMLRAMIQAAKADGRIDEAERERLLGQLGDLDDEDRAFIRQQMAAPIDAQALAREVPQGLEAQVYLMSLMAIDLDSREEAEYLHSLADALQIDRATTNQIHEQVGVQNLYS